MTKLDRPGRYLDRDFADRALALFDNGHDTVAISKALGCSEGEAERAVWAGRNTRRLAQ